MYIAQLPACLMIILLLYQMYGAAVESGSAIRTGSGMWEVIDNSDFPGFAVRCVYILYLIRTSNIHLLLPRYGCGDRPLVIITIVFASSLPYYPA